MMTDQTNLELRAWWIGQIQMITRNVREEEEKRQDKLKRQNLKKLGDYRTYNDIQEAYGVGVITEREFDRLVGILEKCDPEPSALYRAKMDLLNEIYQEQRRIYSEQLKSCDKCY